MKRLKLIILDSAINKSVGEEFILFLYDEANILYAIDKLDGYIRRKLIRKKIRKSPFESFNSVLHMAYHSVNKKFYEQIGIHFIPTSNFTPIRDNPKLKLPDETAIKIIWTGCERGVGGLEYDKFREGLLEDKSLKYIKNNLAY